METVPLVGRDAELKQLREGLARAAAATGMVLGLSGDPGIGKSRLADEAVATARGLGFAVLRGRAPATGGMMYGAIDEILRAALDLPESPPPEETWARVRAEADSLDLGATDRHHLADVLGVRDKGSHLQELDPRALQVNNRIAVKSFLRARATRTPQLVVIDDMHWADELTRDAVRVVAGSLASLPVALLLMYRPGYAAPPKVREMAVPCLTDDAAALLLEGLGPALAPALAAAIRGRAGGNPLYLEEAVRLAHEGEVSAAELPTTLAGVIGMRVARLDPPLLLAAQVAAAIGRPFSAALVDRVAGTSDAASLLQTLEARGFVASVRRGNKVELSFRHALACDVVYASIALPERPDLHRRIATALQDLPDVERHGAALGHHWEQSGDRERARAAYLGAARQAVARNAHADAEGLYRQYLALAPPAADERIRVRMDMAGLVIHPLGRRREAIEMLQAATDEARLIPDAGLEAMGLMVMGDVWAETPSSEQALHLYEKALGVSVKAGDEAAQAEALRRSAILHQKHGRLPQAQARCEEELLLRRRHGDRAGEGLALSNLAVILKEQARFDQALELYRQALGHHRALGRRQSEGKVLANMAVVRMEQGNLEEARLLYEQGLLIHREVGDRRFEGITLGNLANLLRVQGSPFTHVRTLYEQALSVHREVGDRTGEGRVLSNLAGLLEEQEQFAQARGLYHEALVIHREVKNRRSEGITLGNLAKLHYVTGDVDGARKLYEEALDVDREVGERRVEGLLLLDRANLERVALGSNQRAERLAGLAEKILTEVGDQVGVLGCLCEQGHIALAAGRDPAPAFERAREEAFRLRISFAGETGQTFVRLRQAIEAATAGEPLFRGDRVSDLPPGLRRYLEERGDLS